MRLLIFPTLPIKTNGYGICVSGAYERLKVTDDDYVIWYNTSEISPEWKGHVIPRPAIFSKKRIFNLLGGHVSNEIVESDLKGLDLPADPDFIFCGDVQFYRLLRERYPQKKIHVQLHNCFARIHDRMKMMQLESNLRYKIDLVTMYSLERKIFNDRNVYKIFVSSEDRNYYISNFGRKNDSALWSLPIDYTKMERNRRENRKYKKLVWMGSIQPHKSDSVRWFIDDVFKPLKREYNKVEFHLWGGGTELYNRPDEGIFGYGRFEGDRIPENTEDSIFINPDVTGGGIKIKVINYFENGYTFISTPFGYEGYPTELIDDKYCYVREMDEWISCLNNLLGGNK